MRRIKQLSQRSGFTIVEVVVTIVITTLFIITISQLAMAQSQISSTMTAYNKADLLAYNNLRTYAYGKAPSWFDCTYSGGSPDEMTLVSTTNPVEGIPGPVSQTVIATAPYGCGGVSSGIGYPIKVVSTVMYGPNAEAVVHATYSTY